MGNRIIKFRGIDRSTKNFVYGQLAYFFDKLEAPHIMPKNYFATRDFGEEDESGKVIIQNETALGGFIDVIAGTEGQFTGLLDKNGKEIYEGDIVKSTFCKTSLNKEKIIIATVKYDTVNPCFVMEYKHDNKFLSHEYDFAQCGMRTNEVIGNIHQNPELLKTH